MFVNWNTLLQRNKRRQFVPESGADEARRREESCDLSVSTWMDVLTEIGGRSAVSSLEAWGFSDPDPSSSSDS